MKTHNELKYQYDHVAEIEIIYKTKCKSTDRPMVSFSRQSYEILMLVFDKDRIGHKEFFYAMYLSQSNRVLAIMKISEGGLTGTVVDTRNVFQGALMVNAAKIVLSHNHPSGNLKPSQADINITNEIKQGCRCLNLQLMDHMIITPDDAYFSFADEGLL